MKNGVKLHKMLSWVSEFYHIFHQTSCPNVKLWDHTCQDFSVTPCGVNNLPGLLYAHLDYKFFRLLANQTPGLYFCQAEIILLDFTAYILLSLLWTEKPMTAQLTYIEIICITCLKKQLHHVIKWHDLYPVTCILFFFGKMTFVNAYLQVKTYTAYKAKPLQPQIQQNIYTVSYVTPFFTWSHVKRVFCLCCVKQEALALSWGRRCLLYILRWCIYTTLGEMYKVIMSTVHRGNFNFLEVQNTAITH